MDKFDNKFIDNKDFNDYIVGSFKRVIDYLNDLVKFKSYSYKEEEIIEYIKDKIDTIFKSGGYVNLEKKRYLYA